MIGFCGDAGEKGEIFKVRLDTETEKRARILQKNPIGVNGPRQASGRTRPGFTIDGERRRKAKGGGVYFKIGVQGIKWEFL